MNRQISMSSLSDELAGAKTRKKEFLEQMEQIIPWDEWMGIIRPHYYRREKQREQPPQKEKSPIKTKPNLSMER